jgi:hypothetical protein
MLRLNIYTKNGKIVGQDFLREDGTFGHKWFNSKLEEFERGSWRGRAKGDDGLNWI